MGFQGSEALSVLRRIAVVVRLRRRYPRDSSQKTMDTVDANALRLLGSWRREICTSPRCVELPRTLVDPAILVEITPYAANISETTVPKSELFHLLNRAGDEAIAVVKGIQRTAR